MKGIQEPGCFTMLRQRPKKSESLFIQLPFILIIASLIAVGQSASGSSVPHEVLAFYYPWYSLNASGNQGGHWGKIQATKHAAVESIHFPLYGAYSSHDQKVVGSHIDMARTNGITGFIASWWGQKTYENRGVPVLLTQAAPRNFKISVYWEKAPRGPEQITQAVSDLVYLVTRFGTNQAFLKVNGKPVIFVYGRVISEIPRKEWPNILKQAHAQAGPFLLIADNYSEKNAQTFDGLHCYNIGSHPVGKTLAELRTWAAQYDDKAVKLAQQYNRISCVTVIPGYNDTKVRQPGRVIDRQNGQIYRILWEEAIKVRPDWIVITSWNEWHEGTEIEPSFEDGDKYLKLTSEFSRRFLGRATR